LTDGMAKAGSQVIHPCHRFAGNAFVPANEIVAGRAITK
jgi:hypothetical protein